MRIIEERIAREKSQAITALREMRLFADSFSFRGQRAKRACLHAHLATAARACLHVHSADAADESE
ncbi:hypothetical protein AALD22_13170 [Lachnospiraceae bacterium 56-18]